MVRLILILLCIAATIDITQMAYTIDLTGSIANRAANASLFGTIAHSPILATVERWALFLVGFGALAFAMSLRKPGGPNSIGR